MYIKKGTNRLVFVGRNFVYKIPLFRHGKVANSIEYENSKKLSCIAKTEKHWYGLKQERLNNIKIGNKKDNYCLPNRNRLQTGINKAGEEKVFDAEDIKYYTIDCKFTISNSAAYFVILDKNKYKPVLVKNPGNIYKYAKDKINHIIINAGTFLPDYTSNGPTIINHQSIGQDSFIKGDWGIFPITDDECYPLILDNNRFFCISRDRKDSLNSIENLINYQYATCGWGMLFENGIPDYDFMNKELRHGYTKKPRQIVGMLKTGDFFILTCNNAFYKDILDFLADKNIDFAYSLDGGRSTKLIVSGLQINKVNKLGIKKRPNIPNFIEFTVIK